MTHVLRYVAPVTAATILLLAWPVPPSLADDGGWSSRIAFKGDARLRYEGIDEDGEADRDRFRVRTRFGLTAAVQDDVDVVVELSTGGDNPVSANQTLDGGFSGKDIRLNLAYADWRPTDDWRITAGKIKNPLYRAGGLQLIWDNDLNPEGVATRYDNGSLFVTAGLFAAEERSSADDSVLYAVQAGYNFGLGSNGALIVGAGAFGYTDTVGNTPFFDGTPDGNTVDIDGNYVLEYRNTEVFAQYESTVGNLPFVLGVHATQNGDAEVEDTAWGIGARLGSAKAPGTQQFQWLYMDVEADAVVSTFADSNFGRGETDASGHILRYKYALAPKIALGGSLFLNEVDEFEGNEHDYTRIQIDLEFKFN